MNIREAMRIEEEFCELQSPGEDEVFRFTEAMVYLIRETKMPRFMMHLGGYYYEQKMFDLALKYYEMAAEMGNIDANVCLGYIWYYGRTGKRDFEKAFRCYKKGMDAGDLQSAYKIADMYKNGYYVEEDYGKYREIIEDLYPKVKDAMFLNDPLPEIFTRLAKIRAEQGKYDEALTLYVQAREFLVQRIADHAFFGDLNIMKRLVEDLYGLPVKRDKEKFDLFDLFVVLQNPAVVRFRHGEKGYEVRSVTEDDGCVISFEGKWYRNVDDFFAKAKIGKNLLTGLYPELYGWEVQSDAH